MPEKLYGTLEQCGRPRIAVIGDVMLDTYVWGEVSRVSQEGPIPVLRARRSERRAGGAGSVAVMLAALGAEVRAVGCAGAGAAGEGLRQEMERGGVDCRWLVLSEQRLTTTKTRYLGYVQSAGRALQQLLRVDEEAEAPLAPEEGEAVRARALEGVAWAELVVVQDMGKGLFDAALLRGLVAQCRAAGKPVVVDPELADDYSPYSGATCLLPNRFEARQATGLAMEGEADYAAAAAGLLEKLSLGSVVIKLDREGVYCGRAGGPGAIIPAVAREVADVTGAGDMVTAAFALAAAAGVDCARAAALANYAAGLEVAHRGATPLPRAAVLESLRSAADPVSAKMVSRESVGDLVAGLRRSGKRVVFTNGCFDLLHVGHVDLLSYARVQGDVLIVGINTDRSARELKGPGRPINSEEVRARVVASLADVDYVVLFDEASVLPLVREVKPDALVKGGDYTREGVVGHEFVESYGGEVKLAPMAEGFSTTDLIGRIRGEEDDAG
jgi:D-beta-D-heptose 7-phosphate kinase/D-beta-D-heptose 1-phosphate adenosyltransferase